MEVFLPTLAGAELSANQHAQTIHQRRQRSEERARLRQATCIAIGNKYRPDVPAYAAGLIDITYMCSAKRPGDGMYRPRDPSNIGGEIIKGIIDAVVDMGVLPDDDYRYVPAVVLRIERVKTIAEEGIVLIVQELIG